jgi:hypothetical protein
MSELSTSDQIFGTIDETESSFIQAVVSSMYFVDYGIVSKVNSDGTVDVKHAKKIRLENGTDVEPFTLTPSVEILTLSSAEFSIEIPVTIGDRVMLFGLKNGMRSVDVSSPSKQETLSHYSQETLKALPLCLHDSSSKVVLEIDNGKIALKNQINSLKTILDDLLTALTTGWVSINCVVGAPVTPSPTTLSSLNAVKTKFATLFKE